MVKLAICDDEKNDLEALISCVEDYSIERRTDITYEAFTTYMELEKRIGEFDIFFMDYTMPGIDGLTFARTIRSRYNGSKTLIFVSKNEDIVYDAFTVQAHRFLRKPLCREKLYEALDTYFQSGQSAVKSLIVRHNRTTNIVCLQSILYIEAAGKETYIHTDAEQIACHRTITSLEEELRPHGFFRVHRSYLVNMRSVKRFDQSVIEFPDGQTVAISSRKTREFRREYQSFR